MTDDEIETIAKELQALPYPKGPKRSPPAWTSLAESSKAYWRAKARAGEQAPPWTD